MVAPGTARRQTSSAVREPEFDAARSSHTIAASRNTRIPAADLAQLAGPMLDAFVATVVRLAGASGGVVRVRADRDDAMQVISSHGLAAPVLADIESDLPAMPSRQSDGSARGDAAPQAIAAGQGRISIDENPVGKFGGSIVVPLEFQGSELGVFSLFFDDLHAVRGEVIHLLRPVGRFFGMALENAQLEHENLQANLLQERQAMAAEIHDSLAQSLTFARMRMPVLRDAIEKSDSTRALRYIDDLEQELGSANRRMRELITHFRVGLGAEDLHQALDKAVARFNAQSDALLEYQCKVARFGLSAECQVQLMHIVQEALANVRKHAAAKHVMLSVDELDDDLVFTVEDDGGGMAPVDRGRRMTGLSPEGVGLRIMRERASSIAASLSWQQIPGSGTRVTLRIPSASRMQPGREP
jgi:two-component system nitrate/nitrite sensor histidine kinase NarX